MGKKLLTVIAAVTLSIFTANGLGAATLRVPEDYPGIQAAIDAASPGDSVLVGEGSYDENLIIRKPMTLKGSGGPGPVTVAAHNINKPTVTVTETKDVTIEGLTVTGSDISGVMLLNAETNTLRGNVFTRNAKGLVLLQSDGNSITDNTLDGNDQYGLYLDRSSFNTISGNSVDKNGDKGIFLSYANNNAIVGNHANLNTWNGVVLWSSNYNLVTENRTLRNTYGIVESESTGNVVMNNVVWPNLFIILPFILIYLGILMYQIQKRLLQVIYGA